MHELHLVFGMRAGKRCIELGAGVGLVGLSLARLGAQVTLTDKPALLSLLKGNVAKNWLGERPRPGYVIHVNLIASPDMFHTYGIK